MKGRVMSDKKIQGEPDREDTEKMRPFKVALEEAVRMVLGGEITQGVMCVLILKASRMLADQGIRIAD